MAPPVEASQLKELQRRASALMEKLERRALAKSSTRPPEPRGEAMQRTA